MWRKCDESCVVMWCEEFQQGLIMANHDSTPSNMTGFSFSLKPI